MEERIDLINGKRVKVTIKNLTKNTSACDVCRDRKKKCDGKAPCSYCVANNKECHFSQRRKRGPKFKSASPSSSSDEIQINRSANNTPTNGLNNSGAVTIHGRANGMAIFNAATSRYECEIIDKLEGSAFKEFYLLFVNPYMHLNSENIMSPITVAHRVQAYSALAIAARLCGDRSKAQTYMAQARALAGSVFDSPNVDTVAAMLMLAQFCRLTLDVPLYKYYCHLAYGLTKVGHTKIQGKLGASCEMYNIMAKEDLNLKQKAVLIKQHLGHLALSKDVADIIYMLFCENAANMLGSCNVNIVQPDLSSLSNCFYLLQNAIITPQERDEMLRVVNLAKTAINASFGKELKAVYVNTFYCPMYSALVEWKSGHPAAALPHALVILDGLQKLHDAGLIAIVAKPSHIALMGTLVTFFYEQGLYTMAEQMCKKIKHICEILSPEYDFLRLRVDEYMSTKLATIPPSNLNPQQTNTNNPNTNFNTTNNTNNTNNSDNTNNTNLDNTNSETTNIGMPLLPLPSPSPTSQNLTDNYSYSYMNNDLNMMDLNVVNLIDLSAVEGMWVNVMNC
eukprot:Phypoly_transcript_06050.p1 GENE.Phypoly_transcript_06050~~Phypoly_transcript_06050.p1  ORF type:complete len:565 (+),score=69.51 Phypoly_transcript_06050:111-1805(+)